MSAGLLYPTSYKPKEQWSPSGLTTGRDCEMAWFLRYVLGIKEADLLTWEDAQHLERPAKPGKGASPHALATYRDAIKEYNRLTRRALGHAVHDIFALHFDWHPPLALVDWHSRPGRVATEGLLYLPAPEECEGREVEQELRMTWGPANDPLKVWGFADLIVQSEPVSVDDVPLSPEARAALDAGLESAKRGEVAPWGDFPHAAWLLVDYKSCYSFDWVPEPAELVADVAANFYALAVMVREDLDSIACRWIYLRTDEELPEAARAVDFTITREGALAVLAPFESLALRLRQIMRGEDPSPRVIDVRPVDARGIRHTHVTSAKHNPAACDKYGRPGFPNCVYHHANGGPCKPPKLSTSAAVGHVIEREALLRKRREIQSGAPRVSRKPKPTGNPATLHSAPHAETEREKKKMGRFSDARKAAAGAPAAGTTEPDANEGGAAKQAPAPAARKPRAASKPAASSDSPPISFTVGGSAPIPLPADSPLAIALLKVAEALYPEG